ncbi:hypothetical protein JZ751_011269, partial [Albula glossodonta]
MNKIVGAFQYSKIVTSTPLCPGNGYLCPPSLQCSKIVGGERRRLQLVSLSPQNEGYINVSYCGSRFWQTSLCSRPVRLKEHPTGTL